MKITTTIDYTLGIIYSKWNVNIFWIDRDLNKFLEGKYDDMDFFHRVEKVEILNHLIEEGFISRKDDVYTITWKGSVFWQRGGYKGQFRREKITSIYQLATTATVALGALAALIYYVLEIWKFYNPHYNPHP